MGPVAIQYELQPYDQKNALWMLQKEHRFKQSGRLELTESGSYQSLFLLAATSFGPREPRPNQGELTLIFADGARSEPISHVALDWWNQLRHQEIMAIAGLGLAQGEDPQDLGLSDAFGHGVGLFQTEINLVTRGLQNKELAAIELEGVPISPRRAGDTRTTAIFAVSGVPTGSHPPPPAITQDLNSQLGSPGEMIDLTVKVKGPGTLTYQWQRLAGEFVDLEGTDAQKQSIDVGPLTMDHVDSYRVVVRNPNGTAVSRTARIGLFGLKQSDDRQAVLMVKFPDGVSVEAIEASTDLEAWETFENVGSWFSEGSWPVEIESSPRQFFRPRFSGSEDEFN